MLLSISSCLSTEYIIDSLLENSFSKDSAIRAINNKIVHNQKVFLRELLFKLYGGDRDTFMYDLEYYVSKITLLDSISTLTADERKHILAVINSIVNGDLTDIWR